MNELRRRGLGGHISMVPSDDGVTVHLVYPAGQRLLLTRSLRWVGSAFARDPKYWVDVHEKSPVIPVLRVEAANRAEALAWSGARAGLPALSGSREVAWLGGERDVVPLRGVSSTAPSISRVGRVVFGAGLVVSLAVGLWIAATSSIPIGVTIWMAAYVPSMLGLRWLRVRQERRWDASLVSS